MCEQWRSAIQGYNEEMHHENNPAEAKELDWMFSLRQNVTKRGYEGANVGG